MATQMHLSEEGRHHKNIYKTMVRIRMMEEKIAESYAEQEMRCPVHLSIGQEGVAAAVCEALQKNDTVTSGHRAHAHYIAQGGDMRAMIAEIYGKVTGCCKGRGGSMHLIDQGANFIGSTPIVGGTIPIGVGAAWTTHMQGGSQVSVVFHGEGAMEEGVWHEALNFASLYKLPVLFVCENNLYSVYTPLRERQPQRTRTGIAKAHGLYVDSGDGNKPFDVYGKTQKALEFIRNKQGPAFLEFATYRWREHCGPNYDNSLGYRTEKEFEEWKKKDPIPFVEKALLRKGIISSSYIGTLHKAIEKEIEDAFIFAKKSPFPKKGDIHPKHSYASI